MDLAKVAGVDSLFYRILLRSQRTERKNQVLYGLLLLGIAVFTLAALRADRLMMTALYLAAISGLVAVMIYLLGAPQLAVIELSVGAGMVAVLFAFAISLSGEVSVDQTSIIPHSLAALIVLLCSVFLVAVLLVIQIPSAIVENQDFASVFWQDRAADLGVQVVLIFAGALGILGLLTEVRDEQTLKHLNDQNKEPAR
jgi:NADH:ubiquinone oxidoreductase subunit 6 (subunit J)